MADGNLRSEGDTYYDSEGILRGPNDNYYDGKGVLRNPGETFYDGNGQLRSPGETYADASGQLRSPGESFVDYGSGGAKKGSSDNSYDYSDSTDKSTESSGSGISLIGIFLGFAFISYCATLFPVLTAIIGCVIISGIIASNFHKIVKIFKAIGSVFSAIYKALKPKHKEKSIYDEKSIYCQKRTRKEQREHDKKIKSGYYRNLFNERINEQEKKTIADASSNMSNQTYERLRGIALKSNDPGKTFEELCKKEAKSSKTQKDNSQEK